MRSKIGLIALGIIAATTACKNPEVKSASGRTVKAKIAEFDPNAVMELNMGDGGGGGGQRPDEYQMELAFNQSFGAIDECVVAAKDKLGMKADGQLKGDLDIAVKLNPAKSRPLGVNAKLPQRYAKNELLSECLREAVASVPFPTYDGPPIVVEFSTQLDAGTVYEEDDDW
jgi:hypothetical protein